MSCADVTCSSKGKDLFDATDGFNDEDLEKPNFSGKYSSEKIPFILSDPHEVPPIQVPATINQYLRQYQREGIAFLYKRYSQNKGAILADDMGLGKTVQVIGFISAILGKTGTKFDIYGKFLQKTECHKDSVVHVKRKKGVFLIVSPHSVLYNWHEELATWGYFKIGRFHQNKREETLERASMDKLDVVLTTYETLRNHWESLNRVKWLALIMDEVHHLKDPRTAVTTAAKSLQVKCRIGLTGTPLQNRLLELWCVLDWANPGCLGERDDFAHCYGKPIMQGQRFDVTKRELATGRKKTQEFLSMLDEWCLRRTKSLISNQLPQKDQKVVFCPLSKLQEDIYKTLLQTNDVQLLLKRNEPCDCRSELSRGQCCYSENEEGYSMKKLMLQYLKLFLKVANHAALLLPQVKQTEQQRKRAATICEKVFSAHPGFKTASESPSFELFSDSNFCGKMKVLDKLLKLFQQQKDKVLLFSYSTQLLDMLEAYVVSCGMVYRRLDGSIRGERRLRIIREFNTNHNIFLFLVSTKAGGVGLNLTSANVVIVFDPSWNPADDLQAEDRAYRIGQRRDVKVFRMISSGTVEENMYLRQVYKQQLANVTVQGNNERRYFNAVEGEKDKKGELFGIENLFALRNDGCCVSTDIFKRSDKIEKGFRMTKYELQPEKKDVEDKLKSVTATKPIEQCEEENEDQRYDLEEVASQYIEDEHLDSNNQECDDKNWDPKTNFSDDQSKLVVKVESKRDSVEFTKLQDVSVKNKVPKKRSQLPQSEEECKRQKYKKDTATVIKKTMSKHSQVNQILVDCGVQHTHSNKIIIGTSKAEKEMTSRAMKEVFDLGQGSQQPANCFAAIDSDGEESDDIGENSEEKSVVEENKNKVCVTSGDGLKFSADGLHQEVLVRKMGNNSLLFGETPKAIRLRQFSEIAQTQGYDSEVDFAKAIVMASTSDRLNLLKEYYKTNDYPKETVSFFSQLSESSAELNKGNSLATGQERKRENSLKHPKSRRCGKKSGTKVLRAAVAKGNVAEQIVIHDSEGSRCIISDDASPSLPYSDAAHDSLQKNENAGVIDSDGLVKDSKEGNQDNLKKSQEVSVNVLTDNLLKREGMNKVNCCQGTGSNCSSDNTALSSKSSDIPEGPDESLSSSFLDEFLYECSQHGRTGLERGSDKHKREPQTTDQTASGNVAVSVLDDLI